MPKVLSAACGLAAVVLVVGALTFAGPCVHADGSVATCHDAQLGVIGAGVVAALAAFAGAFTRSFGSMVATGVVSACAGVFAMIAPGALFPLCMMQTMRCWTAMRPFALICGALVAILALARIVVAVRSRTK